jgi:DNA-directed RNA polymerase specialized sigma24 family protein
VDDIVERREMLECIVNALEYCNERHRRAFSLRHAQYTYREIGRELGVCGQRAMQMVNKVHGYCYWTTKRRFKYGVVEKKKG